MKNTAENEKQDSGFTAPIMGTTSKAIIASILSGLFMLAMGTTLYPAGTVPVLTGVVSVSFFTAFMIYWHSENPGYSLFETIGAYFENLMNR